jgi:hypothetical protein
MDDFASHALVLAGLVTLLIGLWTGFPLRRAVNQQRSEDFIRGWRVAHSSIIVGGIMLLALVPALPLLALPRLVETLVVGLLAISTGAFCFALILGAMHEHRGLQKTAGALASSIYYGNVVGAILSLIALSIVLFGSVVAIFFKG